MFGLLAFLGAFLAVALIALAARKKIRQFSRRVFGKADILEALAQIDSEADMVPRSLNGCDNLLLPKILKDFPDFDVNLAKTYAREYITKKLTARESVVIHNVVIARYLPSGAQKTIVFQAAVSYQENGNVCQMRYDLDYTFLLDQRYASVAANCPNCGAALGYGDIECSYCGSRVANVLGNTWEFTEMRES